MFKTLHNKFLGHLEKLSEKYTYVGLIGLLISMVLSVISLYISIVMIFVVLVYIISVVLIVMGYLKIFLKDISERDYDMKNKKGSK